MPARALINTIRPRASRVVRSYILSYYSIHRRDNGRIRTFRTLRPRRNFSHRGHIILYSTLFTRDLYLLFALFRLFFRFGNLTTDKHQQFVSIKTALVLASGEVDK